MKYLNLGCGNRFNKDWINIDVKACDPSVISYNLTRGIPLEDDSCDVVYHSHIIEHFRRDSAVNFMKECYRVLKPGGILRVATPDLERICRIYLEKLESIQSNQNNKYDYEWMMLELYDQTVREQSGGQMLDYLKMEPLLNEAFVYERIGEEGRNIIKKLRQHTSNNPEKQQWQHRIKMVAGSAYNLLDTIRTRFLGRIIFGQDGIKALEIGRFRLSGEIHQWMYDQYSLSCLMESSGFRESMIQSATTSLIPNWTNFNLDTLPGGIVNKPDSLYMEAIKPIIY